VFIATETP